MVVFQFIKFIKKNWLLFALLIAYFIAVAAGILPSSLSMFNKSGLSINNTPVLVKEINEIGELITAEFYGETYGDILEAYEMILTEEADSIKKHPDIYTNAYPGLITYRDYKHNYEQTIAQNKQLIATSANESKQWNNERIEKENALKSLQQQLDAQTDWDKRREITKKIRDENALLYNLNNQVKVNQQKIQNARAQNNQLTAGYYDQIKQRNLVYIGRGWVKAGFDFQTITKNNFKDTESDSIYIVVGEPQILMADINPWYIKTADTQIEGYELFMEKTGGIFTNKNFTDMEVKAVKRLCKEKLIRKAEKHGILYSAEATGKQVLTGFFGALGFQNYKIIFSTDHKQPPHHAN